MSAALRATKRRFARRGAQRGAVMFIVAMTLAVLASLGLYALGAASTEVRTAGYERVSTQSHYLSEYGALGAAENINYDTAQTYFNLANDTTKRDTRCISLPAVHSSNAAMLPTSNTETRVACYRIGRDELAQMWPGASNISTGTPALPTTNPLGPYPTTGDFYAELTDTACAPMAGMSGRMGMGMLTLTTIGFVYPSGTLSTNTDQLYGNEAIELARLRIAAGPIVCPQLGQ